MKKILLLLLIFVLVLPLVGQGDSLISKRKKQLNLEVKPVGVGLSFNIPFNNTSVFTLGFQTGFILTYFIAQTKERENNFGYVELLGVNAGIVYYSAKHWQNTISLKLGIPFIAEGANFQSPFIGGAFNIDYKISKKILIGTNIDVGLIKLEGTVITSIATSFISLKIKI